MSKESIDQLKARIEACAICASELPHEPRPVTSWHPESRVLIIGQAPGRVVHESGVPWQDASGRLLREWLGVTSEEFYDPKLFALMPMGFCFPGKGKSGDMAPRRECAPQWHEAILGRLEKVELTLLIGLYAQNYYLDNKGKATLTDNVREFQRFLPKFLPMPHPSPRNRYWLSKNPWFGEDLIPVLKERIGEALRR